MIRPTTWRPYAVALTGLWPALTLAQSQPSRVDCRAWDQAFLTVAHASVWAVLFVSIFGGLVFGYFFGTRFWTAAAPRLRVAAVAAVAAVLAILVIAIWPMFGLGTALFASVPPSYLLCQGVSFGADGLFGGLFGPDVAAISQVPSIVFLIVVAATVGGAICVGLGHLINRRPA